VKVDQRESDALALEQVPGAADVGRRHDLVTPRSQRAHEQLAFQRRVFDDQHSHRAALAGAGTLVPSRA
jgi:hypothetical protein